MGGEGRCRKKRERGKERLREFGGMKGDRNGEIRG